MKLLDIISENEENNPQSISDKEIQKLKKLRIALDSGIIKYWEKDNNIYTYKLSSNYIPYNNGDGLGNGLAYRISDRPFGVQIYQLKNNEPIPLFDKLTQADIDAIFFDGTWENTTRYGSVYEVLFNVIRDRFSNFGSYIWVIK